MWFSNVKRFSCLFFLVLAGRLAAQNQSVTLLSMVSGRDSLVDQILKDSSRYRLQIRYSRWSATAGKRPQLETFSLGRQQYYYPASLVKFPLAIVCLAKMDSLQLSLDDKIQFAKNFGCCGEPFYLTKKPLSFREIFTKMMVVSDNEAYHILYDFAGCRYLVNWLSRNGFSEIKMLRNLSGAALADNLKNNACTVYNASGTVVYRQQAQVYPLSAMAKNHDYSLSKLIGKGVKSGKTITYYPYDFNYNLEIPLDKMHAMMVQFVYPQGSGKWQLSDKSRDFLRQTMALKANEMQQQFPTIKSNSPYAFKFLGMPVHETDSSHVVSVSKVGFAYGFLSETAFVRDSLSGRQAIISVSIYLNNNHILNDGIYEYESIGRPFLNKLGLLLLEGDGEE